MFDFTQHVASRLRRLVTPQRANISNSGQLPNSARGYTRLIDDWFRLDQVLTLGAESGTLHIRERPLTHEDGKAVMACLAEDGPRVVRRAVEISANSRAPKNEAAIFVLAMAAGSEDDATRTAALDALPRMVCIEV